MARNTASNWGRAVVVREIPVPYGPFVARADNGSVRVGFRGGIAVQNRTAAFRELANAAPTIASDDDFDAAVNAALETIGAL